LEHIITYNLICENSNIKIHDKKVCRRPKIDDLLNMTNELMIKLKKSVQLKKER